MQSLAVVNGLSVTRPEDDNVLQMMLQDKRSEATRAAYAYDVDKFFHAIANRPADPGLIQDFFMLERGQAMSVVIRYKADLIRDGLSEATINRRLAAIKSLVKFARRLGRCEWDLSDVEGERQQAYRDTSGIDEMQVKALLKTPDRSKLKGKRDYAILRLLWENGLRRSEIAKCNKQDFDPEAMKLAILGKGYGSQKVLITLSDKCVQSISAWLAARDDEEEALFITLNNATTGRLTGAGIYYIIEQAGKAAGITKKLSPHRIRHSSITAALDHGADVRKVQKLSRHSKIETLMLYDDSRHDYQGEISRLLSCLA